MRTSIRSTPMEIALLKKIDRLPVIPRKRILIHQFDFSRHSALCWYHGIDRNRRRYSMMCDVCEDGSLEVTSRPVLRKALRMPKAKRFHGQIGA